MWPHGRTGPCAPDRLLVCLHRHGDRSGGTPRRPLVPRQDLLLPRPGPALRRAIRQLCRVGRRRAHLPRHLLSARAPTSRAHSLPSVITTPRLLLGVGLYYGVLVFNLGVTFWIGESFMGMSGLLMHLPVLILLYAPWPALAELPSRSYGGNPGRLCIVSGVHANETDHPSGPWNPRALVCGWLGYQLFTTGFSAKTEPHAIEVFLARQIRHLAIPIEQRNSPNPVPLDPGPAEGRVGTLRRPLRGLPCERRKRPDTHRQECLPQSAGPPVPRLNRCRTANSSGSSTTAFALPRCRPGAKATPEQDMDSWKLVHFIRHLPQLTPEELDQMKGLNPKTKHATEEEAAFDQFLQGDDSAATTTGSGHHH